MAIDRNTRYPGRFDAPTAARPQGAFKNRSAPGAKDGSYLERDWANDWDGFFGSLLRSAGLTPNGTPDTALASQYFDALRALGLRQATEALTGVARIATRAQVLAGTDNEKIVTPINLPRNTAVMGVDGWWKCGDTGLIRQRRRVFVGELIYASTQVLVTWPVQFPRECSSIVATFEIASGVSRFNAQYAVISKSVASCTLSFDEWSGINQSALYIYVEAEGY